MSDTRVSVVTINKGREAHLARLLDGLARGGGAAEIVVVEMGASGERRMDAGVLHVPMPGEGLPLARARNTGRHAASGDVLVFLDVDCIPSRDLVPVLTAAVAEHAGLICCEALYLSEPVPADWTEADLVCTAVPHPARRFPRSGISGAPHPGLFWSLAFGVSADVFDGLAGFDEAFTGYGAEDTDLAFRAAARGIPILFSAGGRVFHQRHETFEPPLGHFADILRNASVFRRKHDHWPMRGWLDAFVSLGLISLSDDTIQVLRSPTADDIARARVPITRAF